MTIINKLQMKKIIMTELDYIRLKRVIENSMNDKRVDPKNLSFLTSEIERAEKIDSKNITQEFVTMNSTVKIINKKAGFSKTLKIVYPDEADFNQGFISVLSPLGTALIGYRVGDFVQYEAPKGKVKVEIIEIEYQPEANGEYFI